MSRDAVVIEYFHGTFVDGGGDVELERSDTSRQLIQRQVGSLVANALKYIVFQVLISLCMIDDDYTMILANDDIMIKKNDRER